MSKKILLITSLIFITFLITPRPVSTKTDNFDVYTTATEDAWINNETLDGSGDWFNVGNWSGKFCESYLYFPFTDKPSSWFSAEISLYFQYDDDVNITVSLINYTNNYWDENNLQWIGKPNGTVIGNLSITSPGLQIINVTDYITTGGISIRLNASDINQNKTRGYTRDQYPDPQDWRAPRLIWRYSAELIISLFQPHSESSLDFGYQTIRWTSNTKHDYVMIELYKGSSFITTIVDKTDDDGEYEKWRIHQYDTYDGDNYRLKIIDYDEEDVFGWSDYFEISISEPPPNDTPWMGMEWFILVITLTIVGLVIGIVVIKKMSRRSKDEFNMDSDFDFQIKID